MTRKTKVGLTVISVGVVLAGLWWCGELSEKTPVVPDTQCVAECDGSVEQVSSDDIQHNTPVWVSEEIVIASMKRGHAAPQEASGPDSSEVKLHPAVRNVLECTSYDDRLNAITYEMPEDLGAADYQGIRNHLLTPQPGRDHDAFQHEYALRNYMMDALRAEEGRLGETVETFIAVYADPAQGNVMRGYALQHLASIYIDNVAALSATEKGRIVKTFNAALEDRSESTLASTALVGLQDISRWDGGMVSPATVGSAAMKLLESDSSSTLAKISAFQIAGELKLKTVGSHARKAAFEEDVDRVLRMSAVYALGQLGETAGLEKLLSDADRHVKRSAQLALKERG